MNFGISDLIVSIEISYTCEIKARAVCRNSDETYIELFFLSNICKILNYSYNAISYILMKQYISIPLFSNATRTGEKEDDFVTEWPHSVFCLHHCRHLQQQECPLNPWIPTVQYFHIFYSHINPILKLRMNLYKHVPNGFHRKSFINFEISDLIVSIEYLTLVKSKCGVQKIQMRFHIFFC